MGEHEKEQSHIPVRLNVLFFIVFMFFAAIILRLAYVQLVEGEQYKHDLEKYSTRELPIPAPRGRILDTNGQVLVSNKPVYTVTYVEEQNQDIDEEQVADKLANVLIMDDEKTGTDKDLLKKAIELQASLPVSFKPDETNKLISMITPKLNALPPVTSVSTLQDRDLIRTALYMGMRVRSPFSDGDRETVRKKVSDHVTKAGKAATVNTQNASDAELLHYVIQSNIDYSIKLDEDERESLEKEVKAQIATLPDANGLKEKSDMDLLRYANLFDLTVALPLTDQQRQFQWRKMAILGNMRSYGVPRFIPRRIKENVSYNEVAKIDERRSEYPGINVIVEPIRQIRRDPDGSGFATHILGYINPISPEQRDEYVAQGYSFTDRVGVAGLERYYERELRGKDGVYEVHVNKDSETVEKQEKRPAEPGNDLVLSLDWRFQSKVEDILKTNLAKMRTKAGDLNVAHAVVMNPNTGEVLAMASSPDYDLNLHYNRKEFNKVYDTMIAPSAENKMIRGAYAPGSTAKMLSVMLSLQKGLVTPNETIYDPGYYIVGNVKKRNWKLSGHGNVNARRALQVSNNTYMYAMAMRLVNSDNKSYMTKFSVIDYYNAQFGLGVKTGIDLPSELTGWESQYSYMGNLADAFIGQYDSFTPMQIAQYVSTIANGGYRLRPHLVKEIRRGTVDPKRPGETLTVVKPEVLNTVDIDPKWIKVAQEGMRMVTGPGGTAASTFSGLPFTVAAKTGTAQTGRGADNSLIVGYAPYEKPEIVFVVIVPGGGHGSDSSGPIARQVLEAYHSLYPLNK
ncbi:peptidoglycan D,D-transpeptidase FtsI family protein [Brevibacillus dissolubilis]|uniref:peptidoglycan D,D-transpeptidase FtsI family protein n=1 Tax=Brevibacillus dissolubilis TaxID=1844116 RepID=UPI001117AC53|nr:penicillin-binding transpeptidase domain-containing protein [Brevibacillus dissolubilis]